LSARTAVLSVLDIAANACGLLRRPLQPDELVETARRRTGLHDFGGVDFAEPLRRLLESCTSEVNLGLVGHMATRWDVLRFLSNLLRLRQEEKTAPAVLDERIECPIFITGLPRSGTTFLHRMMMLDLANRAPLVWRTIYPYPKAPHRRDTRQARVARQLRAFERLASAFHHLHPLQTDSPQECSEITAHVFRSLRFDTTYRVPCYRAWLDNDMAQHLPAYRFHRRFLQHLQHQVRQRPEARWVMKCPDHLFALDVIRTVYPDARMVFVHRDPLRVLLSVARLTEVLRHPCTRYLDRAEIGRQESARWLDGTRHMIASSNDVGFQRADLPCALFGHHLGSGWHRGLGLSSTG
jgi:Sulfotransferase family